MKISGSTVGALAIAGIAGLIGGSTVGVALGVILLGVSPARGGTRGSERR